MVLEHFAYDDSFGDNSVSLTSQCRIPLSKSDSFVQPNDTVLAKSPEMP